MGAGEGSLLPFDYDQQFKDDLQEIQDSDSTQADSLASRCRAIRRDPFKGEWKSWAMDGLYGLHADPLIILYQLEPNLSPNNDRSHVDKVYFWRIVHHDDQQTAVNSLSSGESQEASVNIRMYYEDTPSPPTHVSELYDANFVQVDDDKYDSDGVVVSCSIPDTEVAEENLRELIPDAAEVVISRTSVSDVLDSE